MISRHGPAVALFAITYLVVLAISLLLGAQWVRADSAPAIRVLGSGSSLSLLITAGNGRMLIASGDDATAFSNALAGARHLTSRRIDLLVLAGDDDDIAVTSRARRDLNARSTLIIDGPLRGHLSEFGLGDRDVIARSIAVHLPGGVDVTIAPATTRDGGWSATIRRGDTVVIAGTAIDARSTRTEYASTVIATAKLDRDEIGSLSARLLVISSKAMSGSVLRDASSLTGSSFYAIRVEPARAVTLNFVNSGLRIPSTAVQYGSD